MGMILNYIKPLKGDGYLEPISNESNYDVSIEVVKFSGQLNQADKDLISETLNAEFLEIKGSEALFKK